MRATQSAASPLQHYRIFRRQHPRTAIPADYVTEDGFRLGRWQERHRVAHMLGTLPPQRIAQLDAIGFMYSDDDEVPVPAVSRADSKQRRMLTEIAAYREEHGNALVPANYVTADGEHVGRRIARRGASSARRARGLPRSATAGSTNVGTAHGSGSPSPRLAACGSSADLSANPLAAHRSRSRMSPLFRRGQRWWPPLPPRPNPEVGVVSRSVGPDSSRLSRPGSPTAGRAL